jgi:aspartate aminotransferase
MTLAVTARAAALRRQGVDVIGFGAGEPDFDTPVHIKEAAKAALDRGATKYTDVGGTPELREAVARWLGDAHGLDLRAENILVSVGAKHALFNLMLALLDAGDEVIVPAPYWVSYPELVTIAGGKPVIVETSPERGFKMTAEELEGALGPRTRAVILCSPSNPTGSMYGRAELEALAAVCVRRDLLIISDDIYRSLVYGRERCTEIATLGDEVRQRTLIVDGVSKAFAMTGWRIGFTAAPVELVQAMAVIQGQSTTNAAAVSQAAALAAVSGSQDCIELMRCEFDRRRRVMVERLRAMPGVRCHEPEGAFYAFPDLRAFVGHTTPDGRRIDGDLSLCEYLLDAGHVALVPGSGFGAPGFARLSYATSLEAIERGLDRMAKALAALYPS